MVCDGKTMGGRYILSGILQSIGSGSNQLGSTGGWEEGGSQPISSLPLPTKKEAVLKIVLDNPRGNRIA